MVKWQRISDHGVLSPKWGIYNPIWHLRLREHHRKGGAEGKAFQEPESLGCLSHDSLSQTEKDITTMNYQQYVCLHKTCKDHTNQYVKIMEFKRLHPQVKNYRLIGTFQLKFFLGEDLSSQPWFTSQTMASLLCVCPVPIPIVIAPQTRLSSNNDQHKADDSEPHICLQKSALCIS